jgi:hypothetical protein
MPRRMSEKQVYVNIFKRNDVLGPEGVNDLVEFRHLRSTLLRLLVAGLSDGRK